MTNHSPSRLTTMRKALLACACIGVIATPVTIGLLRAQNQNYTFEVVSIRASPPETNGTSMNTDAMWIRAKGTTVVNLILNAYGMQPDQLSGIPNWARDEQFDLTAKYDQMEDENIPPGDQERQARRLERHQSRLRNMLGDRFQLKLREEMKELPLYSLKIDGGGHKMKPMPDGKGSMNVNRNNGNGTLRAEGITMKTFIGSLNRIIGKNVINDTGLDGLYMVELKWSDSTAPDAPFPSIFTAIKEQLGLKLESTKGPVKTYMIEKIERPSEN